jgi:hypothetical protein
LGSALALLPIPWSATNSLAHPTEDLKKGNAKKMNAIEILPGKSIGELHLGARTKDLPNRAVVNGPAGSLDGIHFFAPDGVIEDIWIEDLRKFPREVGFAGKLVPRNASLDEIKQAFGPCLFIFDDWQIAPTGASSEADRLQVFAGRVLLKSVACMRRCRGP